MKSKALINNGKIEIGSGKPPYLIAEIGTNHNQDLQMARDLIKEIAAAGFDCVKFQTYEPYEIVGTGVQASEYGLEKYYGDISAYEMFDNYLKTPKAWFPELRDLCRELNIDCATTIHGRDGLNWAKKQNFDIIKIASMDHNNFPFLKTLVNAIDAPLLISFGMATWEDIMKAVEISLPHLPGLGIFHCVSVYPPQPEELRLANIPLLLDRFNIPVGFSDHSDDVVTSLAALSLGAQIFEKHVTLDRSLAGPDHPFSLEPGQMKSYVKCINHLFRELKSNSFVEPVAGELANRTTFTKSIVIANDIPSGHILAPDDLELVRPGTGIPPKDLNKVVACRTKRALNKGSILAWEDLVS